MNYSVAHSVALERFQKGSIEEMIHFSGYEADEQGINIDFMGQKFSLEHPGGVFKAKPGAREELPLFVQILILHYLSGNTRQAEGGKLVSYKELPGGEVYNEPFINRSIRPLVHSFGQTPEKMLKAAQHIGGKKNTLGDVSVTINVFPKVPVTLVLWKGDEEFPPAGTILFDESISQILHIEDCAVLASAVVSCLKVLAKELQELE